MTGDRIFGAVMIVLALGYILSAMNIQTSFMSDPVGPRIFPYIIAGVVIVCSLAMVLRPDPEADWPALPMVAKLGAALAVLVAYTYAIKPMGFIIPTTIASGILSYMISPRAVPAALAGLGLGVGLFVLFKVILGLGLVALPRGWM
ncbi:MAG TPA: tripartite tricarboxylate transporter TctB family protein [Paracoccaceae bacterium]|nr:tripartite tricarboxylate transporter TctB family protein [Paracoccaceae bacterium]HMO71386.1 tripartite tricarboxylate transporter TctB family protein [Paracoccaceae bacterium]